MMNTISISRPTLRVVISPDVIPASSQLAMADVLTAVRIDLGCENWLDRYDWSVEEGIDSGIIVQNDVPRYESAEDEVQRIVDSAIAFVVEDPQDDTENMEGR